LNLRAKLNKSAKLQSPALMAC